jgi:hypothetical protein
MDVQQSSECESEMIRSGDGGNKRLSSINQEPKGDVRNVSLDGSETVTKTEERMKVAGVVACLSATAFAIPHFWFYCGVSLTYPGDLPQTTPDNGALLIVGGFALLAAAYAIAFTHLLFVKRLPKLIVTLPALFGGIGFTFWGLSYFSMRMPLALGVVSSTSEFAARNAEPNAAWGYYWYSLFIVWGLSLVIAAFYYLRFMKSQQQPKVADNSLP